MRAGVSNRGGWTVFVVCIVLAAAVTVAPYAVTVAVAVALVAVLGTIAHDHISDRLPGCHTVYRLVDSDGTTLYVGSTVDLARRLDEHTNGDSDPWRRHIHAAIEHRLAVSERQARRIEERLIRAMTRGADSAFCAPLHNETWTQPASNPLARTWAWVWMWLYVAQSWVFRGCTWAHPNGVQGWAMFAEHRPSSADLWDLPNDDPTPSDGTVHAGEADYERPTDRHADTPGTSRVTRHAHDPYRGRPERQQRDSHERDSVTPTGPDDDTPDIDREPSGGADDETADERRRRLARERQARARARTRAHTEPKTAGQP